MVSPLNAFVPIVDPATGRPSPDFVLFWQTQLATNDTIPDLTTAAAVSNTIDILGDSPGSVLLRGTTSWAALSIGSEGQVLRVGSGGVGWENPKDSDLSVTDITTNNVSTAKHGFAPKAPNDATKFLNGVGAWAAPKDSDLAVTDITTNDVSTTKHGFAPKAPNDATKFLNGLGAWAVPASGGGGGTLTYTTLMDRDLSIDNITTTPVVVTGLDEYDQVHIQLIQTSTGGYMRAELSPNGSDTVPTWRTSGYERGFVDAGADNLQTGRNFFFVGDWGSTVSSDLILLHHTTDKLHTALKGHLGVAGGRMASQFERYIASKETHDAIRFYMSGGSASSWGTLLVVGAKYT